MFKKKLFLAGITSLLVISNLVTAFASETSKTFSKDDSLADIPVTCEIGSGYIVSLPALVALEKTDEFASYTHAKTFDIGVTGNIASDKVVTVRPGNKDGFVLKDATNDRTVNPVIIQEVTEWSANELGDGSIRINKQASIFAEVRLAGNYSGNAEYEFFLGKDEGTSGGQIGITKAAGLYDADGNMLIELTKEDFDKNYSYSNNVPQTLGVNPSEVISAVIPSGASKLGTYSFRNCTNLKEVSIPASVTTIGDYCFNSCSSLENVKLTNGLERIEYYAFSGCKALESIVIPETVTYVSYTAFNNVPCKAITNLSDYSSSSIMGWSSHNYGEYEITKEPTCTTSGSKQRFCLDCGYKSTSTIYSLGHDYEITEYVPTDSYDVDGHRTSVCDRCGNVKTDVITYAGLYDENGDQIMSWSEMCDLSETVWTEMGSYDEYLNISGSYYGSNDYPAQPKTFEIVKNAYKIVIDKSVKTIGNYAFSECNMHEIILPEGLEYIGMNAFEKCKNLEKITIPSTVGSNESRYGDCDLMNTFKDCTSLKYVDVRCNMTGFYYSFVNCTALETVITNQDLGYGTFKNCKNLKNLYMTDEARYISGDMVNGSPFMGCDNTKLTIYSELLEEPSGSNYHTVNCYSNASDRSSTWSSGWYISTYYWSNPTGYKDKATEEARYYSNKINVVYGASIDDFMSLINNQ